MPKVNFDYIGSNEQLSPAKVNANFQTLENMINSGELSGGGGVGTVTGSEYGVEWDINVADPHLTRIGNLSFHRTLPIQSGMKPCIAQSDKIMYWLNETDRRFRKDTTGYIVTLPLTIDSGVYKLVD